MMKQIPMDSGKKTKYALIAEALKADIAGGKLQPDDQLPSFAEMTERFGVAKHTIERAHAILEQEGLIRREQGKGIFVQPPVQKNKTGLVGYLDLWPHYSSHSPYMVQLQKGMRQAASQAGKHLVLIDSPQSFANWDNLEGLLLCEMGKINRQELRRMIPANLPVMNLLYNDPVFPSVQADDAAGGRLLTEHLLELGHRRIGYLGFYNGPPIHLRYQAHRETLLRNGIEPVESWSRLPEASLTGSYCKAGYFTMRQWLKEGFGDSGCTAILAQNDQTAFGIIRALQEADIDVPHGVSVAGFDGVPNAALDGVSDEYWQPLQLTTVKVPLFDIATIALKVLLGKTTQTPQVGRPIVLPVELKEGESCIAVSDVFRSYDAVHV